MELFENETKETIYNLIQKAYAELHYNIKNKKRSENIKLYIKFLEKIYKEKCEEFENE